jgi:hypothetical protein
VSAPCRLLAVPEKRAMEPLFPESQVRSNPDDIELVREVSLRQLSD